MVLIDVVIHQTADILAVLHKLFFKMTENYFCNSPVSNLTGKQTALDHMSSAVHRILMCLISSSEYLCFHKLQGNTVLNGIRILNSYKMGVFICNFTIARKKCVPDDTTPTLAIEICCLVTG